MMFGQLFAQNKSCDFEGEKLHALPLYPFVSVYVDETATITWKEVQTKAFVAAENVPKIDSIAQKQDIWLRFALKDTGKTKIPLFLYVGRRRNMTLYTQQASPARFGAEVNAKQLAYYDNRWIAPLPITLQKTDTFYLKIPACAQKDTLNTEMQVLTKEKASEIREIRSIRFWARWLDVVYAILLFTLSMSIGIQVYVSKQKAFLFYTGYLFFMALLFWHRGFAMVEWLTYFPFGYFADYFGFIDAALNNVSWACFAFFLAAFIQTPIYTNKQKQHITHSIGGKHLSAAKIATFIGYTLFAFLGVIIFLKLLKYEHPANNLFELSRLMMAVAGVAFLVFFGIEFREKRHFLYKYLLIGVSFLLFFVLLELVKYIITNEHSFFFIKSLYVIKPFSFTKIGIMLEAFYFSALLGYMRTQIEIGYQHERLETLKAQINTHFLGNSIAHPIQHIADYDVKTYLKELSKLLRQWLESVKAGEITVASEIELCEHYINVMKFQEDKRGKRPFYYEIKIDENVDIQHLKMPSIIFQPFIENALKYGLLPKVEADRCLKLLVQKTEQGFDIVIQDNGVGLEKGREIKEAEEELLGHAQNAYSTPAIDEMLELYERLEGKRIERETVSHEVGVSVIFHFYYC